MASKKNAADQRHAIGKTANDIADMADQAHLLENPETLERFGRLCDLAKRQAENYREYMLGYGMGIDPEFDE